GGRQPHDEGIRFIVEMHHRVHTRGRSRIAITERPLIAHAPYGTVLEDYRLIGPGWIRRIAKPGRRPYAHRNSKAGIARFVTRIVVDLVQLNGIRTRIL